MNCEEAERFLDAYLDRELDVRRHLELEQHLSFCPSCESLAQEHEEFRSLFAALASHQAPPQLRAKVLAAVRREQEKPIFAFLRQPWIYAVGVIGLSLFLALKILFPDAERELSLRAALRHSHSLSADHFLDVASANPRVVKSWLTAQLDFA